VRSGSPHSRHGRCRDPTMVERPSQRRSSRAGNSNTKGKRFSDGKRCPPTTFRTSRCRLTFWPCIDCKLTAFAERNMPWPPFATYGRTVTCTYSAAAIRPRRTRFIAAGLTRLVGAAIVAFASVALAQPAGDIAGSEPDGPAFMRPLSAIQSPGANVRAKSTAVSTQYYNLPGSAFKPIESNTTFANAGTTGCIYATGGLVPWFSAPLQLPAGSIITSIRL
jgi:hypothetical protein